MTEHDSNLISLSFILNGEAVELMVNPGRRLLDLLRLDRQLTGPKQGCSIGRCGACTVQLDGAAVPACLLLAYQVQGRQVTTIEGLREQAVYQRVAESLVEHGALQCGYCTPGIVSSLSAALSNQPQASAEQLNEALQGNLCRCTGYAGLQQVIRTIAASA